MNDFIVTTGQGKVRGKTCVDYHGGIFYSFSGIPYAKAPIGPLRFKVTYCNCIYFMPLDIHLNKEIKLVFPI